MYKKLALMLLMPSAIAYAMPAATPLQVTACGGPYKVNGIIEIKAEITGGTGYTWTVAEIDSNKVEFLASGRQARAESASTSSCPADTSTRSSMPGARGLEILTFKALAPGTTSIRLEYRRIWEKDAPPTQVEILPITIDR